MSSSFVSIVFLYELFISQQHSYIIGVYQQSLPAYVIRVSPRTPNKLPLALPPHLEYVPWSDILTVATENTADNAA
jgi:hypothetical protein